MGADQILSNFNYFIENISNIYITKQIYYKIYFMIYLIILIMYCRYFYSFIYIYIID
jgi:hypothetical protein